MGLKLRTLYFFATLTLLVGSFDRKKFVSDMTYRYNVFGGTLNLTQLQLI